MRNLVNVLLLAGAFSTLGFATNLDYVLTSRSSSDTISFSLPSQPTAGACAIGNDCFSISGVSVDLNGTTFNNGVVSFYEGITGVNGGLTILEGNTLLVNNDSPMMNGSFVQLFSGSLSDPTLLSFTDLPLYTDAYGSPQYPESFTLNDTAPEPASALLIPVAGAALLFWRRRRSA